MNGNIEKNIKLTAELCKEFNVEIETYFVNAYKSIIEYIPNGIQLLDFTILLPFDNEIYTKYELDNIQIDAKIHYDIDLICTIIYRYKNREIDLPDSIKNKYYHLEILWSCISQNTNYPKFD